MVGEKQSCFAQQHVPHVFTPGGTATAGTEREEEDSSCRLAGMSEADF